MDYDTNFKQIILCVISSCTLISSGMTTAFTSVALPAMNATTNHTVNSNDASGSLDDFDQFWIVSLPQGTMMVGCLAGGAILNWKGRKFGLLLANLLSLTGWLLMGVLPYLWSIYVSRSLTGLGMGLASPSVSVYIAEISSPDTRSALTVTNSVTFSLGATLTFIFGYYYRVNWRMVSLLCGLFPSFCFLLILFLLPEPKLWKNRTINKHVKFMRPEVIKPLLILTVALFLRQISGNAIILSYTVEMVQQAKVTTDSYLVAIVIGLVKTVGSVFALWLSSKLGRRVPAVLSGLAMSASMLTLATPFQFPFFALTMYILTSSINSCIPQAMLAEVFPTDVRGVASSIAAVNIFIGSFMAIGIHQWLRLEVSVMFIYYGCLGAVSTLFLYVYLPETHGKTLKQIELIFNKKLISENETTAPLDDKNKIIT